MQILVTTKTDPARFWDRSSAVLMAALMLAATTRLAITDWTPLLTIVQTLGVLGVALRLALGGSVFSPRAARWFAFGYGAFLIPAQGLKILEERAAWLGADLAALASRLLDSFSQLIQSQPVYDPLFFLALVSFLSWSMGVYCAYQLTRHRNYLAAVLPPAAALLLVQAYDNSAPLRGWILALYIFLALLLMGRMYYLENKLTWRSRRIFFTGEMESDLSRIALASATLAILAAWSIPGALSSIPAAAKTWNEWTRPAREWLTDAFSALDSPYKSPSSSDFYGATLSLGSSAPNSPQPVFYVSVDKAPPIADDVRYYWRGRAYDTYLNGRWVTSSEDEQPFDPALDRLPVEGESKRYDARFTFTMEFPEQALLYAPQGATWIDRPGLWIFAAPDDLLTWMAAPALRAGDSYRVRAALLHPSEEELRAAGQDYPAEILARYLQIPPELEARFAEVARRAAAGKTTPYDQAQAVTNFIRAEMEYTLKLDVNPPQGEDPILWALTEYKKGFCMYSASAEVLMLRSLGIPARMAVGFAQGQYQMARRRYVAARKDSHAWPEVYFPNIGWVEFEPTGNQPALTRPSLPPQELSRVEQLEQLRQQEFLPNPNAPAAPIAQPQRVAFVWAAPLAYALAALIVAAFLFLERRYALTHRLPLYLQSRYIQNGRTPPRWLMRWAGWSALMPIERAFHTVDLSLRWLNARQGAHVPPSERAALLTRLLPAASESILTLQQEHEAALFAQSGAVDLRRARRAGWAILRAAWRERLFKGKIHLKLN